MFDVDGIKEPMTLDEAIKELKIVRNLMGPSKAQTALDMTLPALELAKEALKHYADEDNWFVIPGAPKPNIERMFNDGNYASGYKIATAALAKFDEIEKGRIEPTAEASPTAELEAISNYRDELRLMICEGEFDFTKIFEEIVYESETYADISNEGADALADYFIGLFELIDEQRRDKAMRGAGT